MAFTWPLVAHFGQTIPGQEVDTWQTFWHFQWTRDAFLAFHNPYFTTRLFYPEGTTLLYETMSPTNDLLGLPIQLLFGTFVTYNTLVLLTFALSGYSVWLLVRHLTGNAAAAYLAGFVFVFAPYRMAQALNHLHLISTQWIVFYIYCLWQALDFEKDVPSGIGQFLRTRWQWLGGATFFLILNIFNDWYYVFFLLIFTGLLVGWRLVTRPRQWRLVTSGVVAAVGTGLLVGLPLIVAMLIRARTAPDLPFPTSLSVEFSADLLSYFTPSTLHPLWGLTISRNLPAYMAGNPTEKVVFLGYVTLVLAGIALWRKPRQSGFWLLVLVTFVVLSLGPKLHINGLIGLGGKDSSIPLPFALLNKTPLAGFVRIPSRFGMVATLAAAVLAGLGFARLSVNLAGRKRLVLLIGTLGLVALEFWTAPFKLANNYVPAVYSEIARDGATKAIIELPLQRNAWDYPRRMYFATVHGKNILQGYTSRPEANPLPPENMPGVRQLLFNDLGPDISYDDSRTAARAFFDFYGLGQVVIDDKEVGAKTLQNTPIMLNQLFAGVQEQKWPQDSITSYHIPLGPTGGSLTAPLLVPGADWNRVEKNEVGPYRWLGPTGRLLDPDPGEWRS